MRLQFEDGEREVFLTRLGLEAKASDQDLMTRVGEWIKEDPQRDQVDPATAKVTGSTDAGSLPDTEGDFVVIDVQSFARMRTTEAQAAVVAETQRVRDRDELIEEAIHDGKFGPSRRDHYKLRYDSDPEGTKKLLGALQKNTVPLEARGATTPTDEVDDDAYPREWAPEVNARAAAAAQQQGGAPVVTAPVRRSRVHSEG